MEFSLEAASQEEVKAWVHDIIRAQDAEENNIKFTIFVSYRGRWCMYCRHYLQELAKLHKQVVKLGGRVFAFCSQNQEKADQAKDDWELPFDYVIGDPTNKISKVLKEEDLLHPIITGDEGDEGYTSANYVSFARKRKHMYGIVQPALLAISTEATKYFAWHINPSLMNAQGAGGRPDLRKIVSLIEDKLGGKVGLDELTTLEELNRKGYKVKTVQLYNGRVLYLLVLKLFGKA